MTDDDALTTLPAVHRRSMLRVAAVGGLALPLVAACGSDDTDSTGAAPSDSPSSESPAPSESATDNGAAGAAALVAVADVPVGGGVIVDQRVVVVQPSEGDFKAFSAICTHNGCPVSSIEDGVIVCPCHGSTFNLEDGAVSGGPAPSPLPEIAIRVEGDEIVEG